MKRIFTFLLTIFLSLILTSCFQLVKKVFELGSHTEPPVKDSVAVVDNIQKVDSVPVKEDGGEDGFDNEGFQDGEPKDEPSARDFADEGGDFDEPQPNAGDGVMDEKDPYRRYPGVPRDVVSFRVKMGESHPRHYHNDRYGFNFVYPSCFYRVNNSQNGDGQAFQCEQVVLRAFAENNVLNRSIGEALRIHMETYRTTYRVQRGNHYIASGYTPNGWVYYEKCVLRGDVFYTARIDYPKRYQNDVEGIISEIAAYQP